MKQIRPILLCSIILLFCVGSVLAQGISATVSSTPSICYNDGSLTVTASGGTAPYQYTITSGPSGPGITYPIILPAGSNTFPNLPSGSYTITVTDALGHTGTITGTVGGSYQFPTLTFDTTSIPGIIAIDSGGLAPLEYAISATSATAGFGPYQPSNIFENICPGKYWVRVKDSCGNIFTNVVTFSYSVSGQIGCVNFSHGTLTASGYGGHPPYTYSINGHTDTTGVFTGLGAYFSGNLVITDSCGKQFSQYVAPPTFDLIEKCPFDSNIYIYSLQYLVSPDTFTFICTNCPPPQTLTVPEPPGPVTDTLFRHLSPGVNYNIIVLSSACGGDTVMSTIKHTGGLTLHTSPIDCNSFSSVVMDQNGDVVQADSFVLSYVRFGPDIEVDTTGIFRHLPDSFYVVTAYVPGGCDTPFTIVQTPYFGSICYLLMEDSACQPRWDLATNSIGGERYLMVGPPGDTVPATPGIGFNSNFYNINPSTAYTLVSDSGCAEPVVTPSLPSITSSIASFLPCVGLPVIQVTGPSVSYCNSLKLQFFYRDSLVLDTTLTNTNIDRFNVTDSGWYHYAVYAVNTFDTSRALRFDTICPLDSGSTYVSDNHVPFPYSNIGYECDTNNTDTITYQIFGGYIPYTVQIPGYDTVTLLTNTGIFPTHHPGTYTVIVYDNCGISRSFTFSVIDTCLGCPHAAIALPDTISCAGQTVNLRDTGSGGVSYQWIVNGHLYSRSQDTILTVSAGGDIILLKVYSASGCLDSAFVHISDTCSHCPVAALSLSDTLVCAGDTVVMSNNSLAAISYQWLVDGNPYSTSADTIFIATAGLFTIELRAYSLSGCMDSAIARFTAVSPYSINIGADTTYCDTVFSRILSTGIASTQWSTGQTGPQITVTTPGKYAAMISNKCGTYSDTITLASNIVSGLSLTTSHDSICSDEPDTVTLYAFIDSLSQSPVTFIWSTGQTNPAAYSASLGIDSGGTYQVIAQRGTCQTAESVMITPVICDSNCTHQIAVPDAFTPNGDNKNDSFYVVYSCPVYAFSIHVYDRWGQLVFESADIHEAWDGTFKGIQQPQGTYIWFVCVKETKTSPNTCTEGTLTLMR